MALCKLVKGSRMLCKPCLLVYSRFRFSLFLDKIVYIKLQLLQLCAFFHQYLHYIILLSYTVFRVFRAVSLILKLAFLLFFSTDPININLK